MFSQETKLVGMDFVRGLNQNLMIRIENPEFTSLCPLTGQPDFAKIIIEYRPNKLCIESKSLKLYFLGYRQHGDFHEACVNRILQDLVVATQPLWMSVKGEFTPRGGIPFWPTATYECPGWNEKLQKFETYTGETRYESGRVEKFMGAQLQVVAEKHFGVPATSSNHSSEKRPVEPLKINKKEFLRN